MESICIKAKDLSTRLLAEHQENNEEILTNKEAETLKNMSFSKTWAFNWLTKNNYESKQLHGEAADVDRAGVADGIARLQEVINDYEPENVYNMDETGLNFQLLPRQTYVHRSEKNIRGTKSMKAKDRVTLYVCTNATGTRKVPLAMIGSSQNLRCFGRNQEKRTLPYFAQKKAWSDTQTLLQVSLKVL